MSQIEGSVQLRIVRGSVSSLSLYEITDHELEQLEEGGPSSTYFNFAIFFISVGMSFLTTLLTVDKLPIHIFTVFVVLAVIGIGSALVLFTIWKKTRSRTKDLCIKIRARVPVAPVSNGVSDVVATDIKISAGAELTEKS